MLASIHRIGLIRLIVLRINYSTSFIKNKYILKTALEIGAVFGYTPLAR